MIERIKEKIKGQVEIILQKPEISYEEFSILNTYLGKLEFEAGEEERRESLKKTEDRMKTLMGAIIGGA